MWILIDSENKNIIKAKIFKGENIHDIPCDTFGYDIIKADDVHLPTKNELYFSIKSGTTYEKLNCYSLCGFWDDCYSCSEVEIDLDKIKSEYKNNFDFMKNYPYDNVVKIEEVVKKRWFRKDKHIVKIKLTDYVYRVLDDFSFNLNTNNYIIEEL